jgi:hypothetical protein
MTKLRDILRNLEQLSEQSLNDKSLEIVRGYEATLVDMNTSQLMDGKLSTGESVGEYRSAEYAAMKKQLNPKGVVDLKLSGAFHNSIFIKATAYPVLFDASDSKAGKLLDAYGINVLGLMEENKNIFARDYFKAEWQKYFNSLLFL